MKSEEPHTAFNTLKRLQNFRYILFPEGILAGIFAGIISVLYCIVLEKAADVLNFILSSCRSAHWLIPLWFAALLLIAYIVSCLVKWEPIISGSGIPQVKAEMYGQANPNWFNVLVGKFVGGVLSIGAGLSLGREGPSIQLGAMVGKGFSRITNRVKTEEKLLITCGASAGLAAAFNAPFAGVMFSLKEIHKNFSVEVLLSAMSASIVSDFISKNVFELKPVFNFNVQYT